MDNLAVWVQQVGEMGQAQGLLGAPAVGWKPEMVRGRSIQKENSVFTSLAHGMRGQFHNKMFPERFPSAPTPHPVHSWHPL
jgi:hypothetical protein